MAAMRVQQSRTQVASTPKLPVNADLKFCPKEPQPFLRGLGCVRCRLPGYFLSLEGWQLLWQKMICEGFNIQVLQVEAFGQC